MIQKDNNNNLPNIYDYNDFRVYLKDYQIARYKFDDGFNKTSICMRMGLTNSRSYFNDVLKGKKVTTLFIDKFITILELNSDEANFFRALVKFNQAYESKEREFYFGQIISLNRSPKKILDTNVYELYKNWRPNVIRSILDIIDFKDDYKELAKKVYPSITVKEAKDSIELLLELGLIKENSEGFLKPADKAISTDNYVKDELVKQFQIQCLEMAKSAVIKGSDQPQDISTNVMSISESSYKQLQELLHKFRAEVRSVVSKDENPADRVYQLDIQLFPNSVLPKEKR